MVAQLSDPQAEEITRALVIERVRAHMANGMEHDEAFAAVWEEIKASGQVEALASLHGVKLVGDVWRAWNIAHRPAAVARTLTSPVPPHIIPRVGEILPPPPQPRRVDLSLVRETLDAEYKIDGAWVRLGAMTSAQCIKVAEQYRSAAIADEHKSRHMRAIAAALQGDETVEQKLSEREVMRLYKLSEPPGNTLA